MPLQRFNTQPVDRPPGLVARPAELVGVTELRLHGVGGTTPEDLLGDSAPQLVSGDRIAGFYRTADLPKHDQVPERHVEAYSWGGLTSRSGSRVLWVLLFPFALANVAGWMCTPRTHRWPPLFWLHRTFVRWAALGVTVNFLLITAMTGMDLVAYQCGGKGDCATSLWWPMNKLGLEPLVSRPGLRILLGALLPVAVIAVLAVLTLRSIARYEEVQPPFKVGRPPKRSPRSAAIAHDGLGHDDFWDGRKSTFDLGCLHIASSLALVAILIGYTARETAISATVDVAHPELWITTLRVGGITVGLSLIFLMFNVSRLIAPALVAVALAAVVSASWFAVSQPVVTKQAAGPLPGMHHAADWTLLAVIAAVGLVLVPTIVGWWRRGTFFIFGPFVALVVSVTVINVVMMGTIVRLAEVLKPAELELTAPEAEAATQSKISIYYVLGEATPYMTLVPVVVVLLFAIVTVVVYWSIGRGVGRREGIRVWYGTNIHGPGVETDWYYSTADPERRKGWTRWRRSMNWSLGRDWDARVARARMVARLPRHVDKVLTLMALGMVTLIVVWQFKVEWLVSLTWQPSWLETAGNWLVAAMPLALILLLRRGWRSLESRRHIGVIWDVITFWPRAYHPFAPPSYAERAVPELQRRLWRIHDARALEPHDPDNAGARGRVVLAAHSQGSVIAAAALLQRRGRPPFEPGPPNDDIGMVTFGSPLHTLYGWGFPAYFNDEVLSTLLPSRSPVSIADWTNCFYDTDYIGRAVFSATANTRVDMELPDPVTCWYIYGQPEPAPARHAGYWSDPKVWAEVDRFAWAPGKRPPPPVATTPPEATPPAPIPVQPGPEVVDRHRSEGPGADR